MIKIKQNIKFLTIVILSNSFVFFASKNHNKYDHTKAFPLRQELTTIRLPIKTPFEYSLEKLNAGIHISIKAKDGETILLAPAAASFDQYSSFEERGKSFEYEIKKLIKH